MFRVHLNITCSNILLLFDVRETVCSHTLLGVVLSTSARQIQRPILPTWLNEAVVLCQSVCEITVMRAGLSAYCGITHKHTHAHIHTRGFPIVSRIVQVLDQNLIGVCLYVFICRCVK